MTRLLQWLRRRAPRKQTLKFPALLQTEKGRRMADGILLRLLLQRHLYPRGGQRLERLPDALQGLETELVNEAGSVVLEAWTKLEQRVE